MTWDLEVIHGADGLTRIVPRSGLLGVPLKEVEYDGKPEPIQLPEPAPSPTPEPVPQSEPEREKVPA